MLDYLKVINDPTLATKENITDAYNILKEYCTEHNEDILKLVGDDSRIPEAAQIIHDSLGWLLRKTIKVTKIEELLTTHIDFIREKVQEQYALENPGKKVKVAKTKTKK